MNRIAHCEVPLTLDPNAYQNNTSRDSRASSKRIDHSVFVPLHYEANYSYPVVVWLHGPNDDQGQLKKIMPHVSMRNYIGISPRGTEANSEVDGVTEYNRYNWRQELDHIADAQERVFGCIRLIRDRFNIRHTKIFLAGYDTGGTMALRLAMLNPEIFSGVISICGGMPQDLTPFIRINQARALPVLLTHGRDSDEYSVGDVCRDLRLLHAGGVKVSVRQYPNEQEITTPMLNDVNRWMMEIITGHQAGDTAKNSSSFSDHRN